MPSDPLQACFCRRCDLLEYWSKPNSSWGDIQQTPGDIQVKEKVEEGQEIRARLDYRSQVYSKRARTLGGQTPWSRQEERPGGGRDPGR